MEWGRRGVAALSGRFANDGMRYFAGMRITFNECAAAS